MRGALNRSQTDAHISGSTRMCGLSTGQHAVDSLSHRLRVFFFSSRRRHTRLTCDWSSDVCSSDLPGRLAAWAVAWIAASLGLRLFGLPDAVRGLRHPGVLVPALAAMALAAWPLGLLFQIGRASCRKRVEDPGVGAPLQIKLEDAPT